MQNLEHGQFWEYFLEVWEINSKFESHCDTAISRLWSGLEIKRFLKMITSCLTVQDPLDPLQLLVLKRREDQLRIKKRSRYITGTKTNLLFQTKRTIPKKI